MSDIVLTTEERLRILFKDVLDEHEKKQQSCAVRLFTINQVAKMTHRSHATIKKKVMEGAIKSTADGLITEQALNDYLKTV